MKRIFLCVFVLGLSSCSTYQVEDSPYLDSKATWVMMPMINNSNTPLASEKAEQILLTQLYAKGINVVMYPSYEGKDDSSNFFYDEKKKMHAYEWLKTYSSDYVITGSIEEWHYKSGLDGEPAVGITIEVKQPDTDFSIWRASGSRGGWGRESVSGSAHVVIKEILGHLKVK